MVGNQRRTPTVQETIWVLGGGQFGQRAVALLREKSPGCNLVVIEKNCVLDISTDVEIVIADGVDWLVDNFTPDSRVDKIIPALPLHLAAAWLKRKLAENNKKVRDFELPDELLRKLPNPIRLDRNSAVISHADFICPLNCSEPEEFCTYTQEKRPPSLYHLLDAIVFENIVPLVLRSRQFASGVGGFIPGDLWSLLQKTESLAGEPLLIGTACKCHGAVDSFCYKDL